MPVVKTYRTKGEELWAAYQKLDEYSNRLLVAEKQRDELVAACEYALSWEGVGRSPQREARLRAAIARAKGGE